MKAILPLSIAAVALCVSLLAPVEAAAPAKISTVAEAADIVAEARHQLAILEELAKNQAAFEQALKVNGIAQAGGVLACLAQALVEHDKIGDVKVAAADLRDAALAVRNEKNLNAVKGGIAKIEAALNGKAGDAKKEYSWTKLVNMHRMMEEANSRYSKLRRTVTNMRRRPERKFDVEEATGHAVALAVLGLPMYADTHEVKDKKDIPEWQEYSMIYRNSTAELVKAIKAKNGNKAYEAWKTAGESCSKCHEVFRE